MTWLRRHAGRLASEAILLVGLFALNLYDEDVFLTLVAFALVIAPPINWTVAGVLIWTSRQAPEVKSLEERANDAVTLALISTSAAVASAITLARIFGLTLDFGRPVLVLLAFGFILVTVPAISWLRTWRDVWHPMVGRSSSFERLDTDTALSRATSVLDDAVRAGALTAEERAAVRLVVV